MHLSQIPQYIILEQKCAHFCPKSGVLWDMGRVKCGIHEFGLWWTWWRHQMETFSALLAICAGNLPVPGEFPAQRPVTPSFDVFFDLRLNNRLSKQSWGWRFETLSCPLWCHCNGNHVILQHPSWTGLEWLSCWLLYHHSWHSMQLFWWPLTSQESIKQSAW